ncbi:DUF4194 domain-containing protein [Cerasicoccus maritimus]|uniref:DUF4194 domain-containing protein n=1 Tax=Cerasicoccus maritimus TaxID=490089 RepID=UPI0028525609|nr:DUF4194 domain-containing protein [Cerasicoccus maritimus]
MNWPRYEPYFPVLIKLLQDTIYSDDEKSWSLILSYRQEIEQYFIKIGMLLVVVEHDEFAYLSNIPRDDAPDGFRDLPKLTKARRLSFPVTAICILLKKHYVQHQENVGSFEPPTILLHELFEEYQAIPQVARNDEWRGRQQFETQINKLISELRVIRDAKADEGMYRILPSINSLVTPEFISQWEHLKLGKGAKTAGDEIELD